MNENPFASPQEMGQPESPVEFRDRTTGLVLFGAIEIVLGLLAAVMLLFMLVTMLASPTPMSALTVVPAVSLYGLFAVGAIWLGIGSIRARRWARAMLLAVAWPWLVGGAMAMVTAALMFPSMYARLARDAKMPTAGILVMLAFTGGIMVFFYLLLPAALVAFYQSKEVRATCERKDPKIRWTDRCPQSVLTLSVLFAFGAYSTLSSAGGGMLFLFGMFLHGFSGAAVGLGTACLCGLLAWGLYRLRRAAWWTAMAVSLLWSVSAVVSSLSDRWTEMYRHLGLSGAQLASTQKLAGTMQPFSGAMAVLGGLMLAGYLLVVRRHFATAGPIDLTERSEPR